MIVNFSRLNEALSRPGHPYDSSSTILKRLNPDDKIDISVNLTEGYYQVPVHEDNQDYLSIILPKGKFWFAVFPMGLVSSGDIFNIVTDDGIKNEPHCFKNMDDILVGATNVDE